MRVMDRMRLAVASVALFVPSVMFALNAFQALPLLRRSRVSST
jgi:hypothetical protein